MPASITASNLARVLACPASCALPTVREPSSERASRGTIAHAYLQEIADGAPRPDALARVPEEHRAFCESIDTLQVPRHGESEVAMAYDVDAKQARRLELSTARAYNVLPTEIAGTADLVLWSGERPVVIDWKTGYSHDPNESRVQLEHYALCVASISWADEVECAVGVISDAGAVEWSRWIVSAEGLANAARRAEQAYERVTKARAARHHDVALGTHCRYCPAWRACPAHRDAVEHFARGMIPEITADSIAIAYAASKAAEQSAESVRASIKRYVEEHGSVKTGNQLLYLNKRGALSLRLIPTKDNAA